MLGIVVFLGSPNSLSGLGIATTSALLQIFGILSWRMQELRKSQNQDLRADPAWSINSGKTESNPGDFPGFKRLRAAAQLFRPERSDVGAKEVRYRSKYTMFFLAELQHQKSILLFSRQKCNAKLFSQHSSVLLLLRNVVRDSDNFFASLFSLEVKLLWRNALACGKSSGR